MYYRISDQVALRSWPKVPCAYYVRYVPYAQPIGRREFDAMLLCDGEHDLEFDETIALLVLKGLVVACDKGDHPSPWSRHRSFANRHFPKMNLMITGRCNYNCLHCFNAADNAPLMTEWAFEELCDLLDQARDCGIHALTITGGEPMAHKRFMDVLREVHRRDMFVEELNTNGSYLTQGVLDEMRRIGCRPLVKVSFDGVGHHDWMRNRAGAERVTLDAMRLCVDNGFSVKAQTQVHRKNVESMMDTARVLDDMGVDEMRIIRTTEVPRWLANAGDACLDVEEYYGRLLEFACEYQRSGMGMDIDIWQFLRLHPKDGSFHIVPVTCPAGTYRPTLPGCRGNRGMVAVTSSGDIVPCLQESGLLTQLGVCFGNLHDQDLESLLSQGPYLDNVCATVGDVRANNPRCGACEWFELCAGGCRAMGLLYSDNSCDFCGEDVTKCVFFKNGWYQRVSEALADWRNMTPLI